MDSRKKMCREVGYAIARGLENCAWFAQYLIAVMSKFVCPKK